MVLSDRSPPTTVAARGRQSIFIHITAISASTDPILDLSCVTMQAEPRSTDISSDVGMEKNEAMLPTNIKTSGSIQEVLPIAGEISLERDQFSEVFCKVRSSSQIPSPRYIVRMGVQPKLMAVKSVTLQKIEAMEAHARKLGIAE